MLKFLILFATVLVVSQSFPTHVHSYCGARKYNPIFHLCCHGHLNSRYGISPQCCGYRTYDSKFQLCCNGHVNNRHGISPHCCGNRIYDSKFRKCHHGRIIG